MHKLITLLFLTTASLAYSQRTCPKQTVLEGDSVIVISHHQMDLINITFLTVEEQKQLISSYERQLNLYAHNEVKFNELVTNLRSQISGYELVQSEQDQIIEELEKCLKTERNKLRLAKATRTIYTIVGVAGGAYLGYVASNFVPLI